MSASSYADWSYIDMRYILHISTIRTLKHESYAQVQISTSKNLRHLCGSILYWNLLAMNISTIRNMWCIYRHQTYFQTCDTNIYIHHAHKYPPQGVALVTCHLPHVGQLIRPLILPNCRKADYHCTSKKLTCYIHENLFLSEVFQKIKIVSSYLTTFFFGDCCCPAMAAGAG